MSRSMPTFGEDQLRALGRLLRQAREERNWTLKRLATESRVSIAAIQKIETGEARPSLLTVIAIAEALAEPLDGLIAASRAEGGAVHFVRGEARGDGASVMDLTDGLMDPRMRGRLMSVKPRAEPAADLPSGEEPFFAYVLRGALRLVFPDGSSELLKTGDAIHIKDEFPTSWSNPLAGPSLILCLTDIRSGGGKAATKRAI